MSSPGPSQPPRAPALIERFIRQLTIAYKAVRLYPGTSDIPRENAGAAIHILGLALQRQPYVQLGVAREGFLYEGFAVFPETGPYAAFAREFYSRNLSEVRFHAGCTAPEVVSFLQVLDMPAGDIVSSGGFASVLWEREVTRISVVETSTHIVDIDGLAAPKPAVAEPDVAEEDGPWPPSSERFHDIVSGAIAGRPRDRRLLVRALSHKEVLAAYLRESDSGRGVLPNEVELSGRIAAVAHAIQYELPEDREALLRSLAEAVLELDPDTRAAVLSQRLLVEARRDSALGQMVRQMSLDEVLDAVLREVPDTDAARSGLTRAVRNLALLNVGTSREGVLDDAQRAMVARGMSPEAAAGVIEAALPKRLEQGATERVSGPEPVEAVLRLLDLTPGGPATYAYDEGLAALREEARRGLTDGDVLASLVTIATLEERPAEFRAIVRLLDESLGLVIDEQEFAVAADAAEALTAASVDPGIDDDRRRRLAELVRVLSRAEAMRAITGAMRVHRHESPEHEACRRLLGVLGRQTIAPLLEVLADEPDMAARKALVDLISGLARDGIDELGPRVADRRWYFVRNVVAILGGTKEPAALAYLERTLRHSDERVRRETIRAVAAIRDAKADAMLVASLTDDDASNVQLAARYLGLLAVRGAAAALEQVARGEGRGNREIGPRVEAIESLGRIGAPGSLRVVEDIARQRGLIAGRTREVRAAAEAAAVAIRRRQTGGVS